MIPAHKHVGPNGPGQIANDITIADYIKRKQSSFDRYPYMKHSTAEPLPEKPKKKLTFDEWWEQGGYEKVGYNDIWAEIVWKAAQQNV